MGKIEAAFEEDASRTDDLGIFGHERPLLGGGGPRDGRDRKEYQNQPDYAHEKILSSLPLEPEPS